MWRSLVAYTSGGRRVAGSNPVIPTFNGDISLGVLFLFWGGEAEGRGVLHL